MSQNRRVVLSGSGGDSGGSLSDRFAQINKQYRSQSRDDDRGGRRDNNNNSFERRKRGGGDNRRGGRGDNNGGKKFGLSKGPRDGGVQKRDRNGNNKPRGAGRGGFGRGGRGGRGGGRGGRGGSQGGKGGKKEKLSKDALDKELDSWNAEDPDKMKELLDADLEDYAAKRDDGPASNTNDKAAAANDDDLELEK